MRARPGRGSDLAALMKLPRRLQTLDLSQLAVPFVVIGGVATAAYMPERMTHDIDLLVKSDDVDAARESLRAAGGTRGESLAIFGSLGLSGETWRIGSELVDLLWSGEPWASEAVASGTEGVTNVVALPFLVLMKLDAARGIDQGDLTRMLGFARDDALEAVRATVAKHLPSASEDLEQYIVIGRFEVGAARGE
jgi:hypothetical protein